MDEQTYYRKYFKILSENNNYSKSYYMNDGRTFAKNVAAGFNIDVEACHGVFCLEELMSASSNSSSTVRTARYEEIDIVEKFIVFGKGDFKQFPEHFLTKGFVKTVLTYSDPADLEDRLGTFYAWKMKLGGCIKQSYVFEECEDDNEENIAVELKSQFGHKAMGLIAGSTDFTTKYAKRVVNKKANVKFEIRTKGGKPELWLAESLRGTPEESPYESIREKWADSFDNTNLYPISYELKPVWELVKKIDPEKGRRYEEYLRGKWDKNVCEINQAKLLMKPKRITSLNNFKEIRIFCKEYIAYCEEEEMKASDTMETYSFVVYFSNRFENWKTAAKDGREEFENLIKTLNDPNTTVKQFKTLVEEKSVHYRNHSIESRGPDWLRLYRDHSDKLFDVAKMVEEGRKKRK